MAILDHWHPILLSNRLRDEPVGVRLGGRDLVLFRAGPGQVGALHDCCVHRRMRLSKGRVVNHRLQCKYHGWTFTCAGAGESPGTPKLLANADSYDTAERFGAVWVKARGSEAEFPSFEPEGYYPLCTLQHEVKAPLEVALDNFTEIEHTPTTHAVFGYDLERMSEVEVSFEPTDTSVRVINHGPQKRLSPLLRVLMGVREGDFFNDDWTTFFSPVYSIYDHWWSSPDQQRQGKIRWRIVIFFNEIDDERTGLVTFAYTKSSYPGPAGGVRLVKPWLIRMLDKEIRLDVDILENLADKNPSIDGMKLSRFDRVLGLNRERIERIYRGKPA